MCLEGLPGGPGQARRPSQRFEWPYRRDGTFWKARDGSGGHPGGLSDLTGGLECLGWPCRISAIGREALPEVWVSLPEVRNISEGLSGYKGRVGSLSGGVGRVEKPSWRSGTDRRLSQRTETGWESIPEVRVTIPRSG